MENNARKSNGQNANVQTHRHTDVMTIVPTNFPTMPNKRLEIDSASEFSKGEYGRTHNGLYVCAK